MLRVDSREFRMIRRLLLLAVTVLSGLGASALGQHQRLSTLFSSDNVGTDGGAVYFDLANLQPVLLQDLELNLDAPIGTAFQVAVHALPLGMSHVGNEASAAWSTIAVDDGVARSLGVDRPTPVSLLARALLPAGTRGIAVVVTGAAQRYTNGNGVNQSYSDATLTLTLGAASTTPFQLPLFAPRVWNGSVGYTPVTGLHPAFHASPRTGPAPLVVTFTDATTTVDPAGLVSILWDIDGDGVFEYSGPTAQHVYQTGGTYTVRHKVTDALHGTLTDTRSDYVVVGPVAPRFTWSANGTTPTTIQFVDASTPTPSSWAWDFDDDGNVDSTLQNPVFAYPRPGIWRARLTVTAPAGNFSTVDSVRVGVLPLSEFTSSYSFPTNVRGFWFTAPRRFSIVGARVPNETGLALQNLAIYRMAAAPSAVPVITSPAFLALAAPADREVPLTLSFETGEHVGVLGAMGDAATMVNSYGSAPFNTQLFGTSLVLSRLRADVNLVTSAGIAPIATGGGPLGRVELAVTPAAAFAYGTGTASGSGASAPTLAPAQLPMLGQTGSVTLTQGDANVFGALMLAFARGNLPTPFGTILLDPSTLFSFGIGAVVPGQNTVSLPVPNQLSFQGVGPVCLQVVLAVAGSPNVLALSNGVEWQLGL